VLATHKLTESNTQNYNNCSVDAKKLSQRLASNSSIPSIIEKRESTMLYWCCKNLS